MRDLGPTQLRGW